MNRYFREMVRYRAETSRYLGLVRGRKSALEESCFSTYSPTLQPAKRLWVQVDESADLNPDEQIV